MEFARYVCYCTDHQGIPMGFEPPIIAQAIEVIVRYRPSGVTERELAETIFGPHPEGYQQRVNQDCRWLADQGYIRRDENSRPYRYFKGRPGPSERSD
jgi:hypothetical protein